MIYIYSFIFSGLICLISEVILNNSKLTPGHVTSLFTVLGVFLSFIGIYPKLINKFHMGAIILISNFGNSLFLSGLEGYNKYGFIGIFKNLLVKSSLVLSATIIFSFIFVLIFKPKD